MGASLKVKSLANLSDLIKLYRFGQTFKAELLIAITSYKEKRGFVLLGRKQMYVWSVT